MFKYTSKYCIMGMAGRGKILDDWRGYEKNKSTVIVFNKEATLNYKKINYSYLYARPKEKGYKLIQLTSKFDSDFFALSGCKWREIRETRNHYNKIVTVQEYHRQDVLNLIKRWDQQSGAKYGWQRHSGQDTEFFNRWYEAEKDNLFARFYYIGAKILGYSVLHRGADDCYEYLIRKTDISLGRNTSLYVDYKTFEDIHKLENKTFFANWGGSKGKLLDYKRKFPRFEETPVYFYTKKNEI